MRLLPLALLAGCLYIGDDAHRRRLDPDGDDVPWPEDCDDDDPEVGAAQSGFADEDGDGVGGAAFSGCEIPAQVAEVGGDCDDADASVFPGATEICNDADDDCDGEIDDDAEIVTWYPDGDGDGAGTDAGAVESCEPVAGHSRDGGDCDDADPAVHPGAEETCDGVDEDCDDLVDDDPVGASTFYTDGDGDGFGAGEVSACTRPDGTATAGGDCDDADPSAWPGAPEACDGDDDDCDGIADDGLDVPSWYRDGDGDGWGAGAAVVACAAPAGHAGQPGDCDDAKASVNPGVAEICGNGVDDDCDGEVDGTPTWYRDADGDGFGVAGDTQLSCTKPAGYASISGDCDDASIAVHPGAEELCDGKDGDCDGVVDEDAPAAPTWYRDADGDGAGNPAVTLKACAKPAGYAGNDDDCDDGAADVKPGAPETCNGVDDDCDGDKDDADAGLTGAPTWYVDDDGDTYGAASPTKAACSRPSGYAGNDDDCDDARPSVRPGAVEVCGNGLDDDCAGGDGACELSAAPGRYFPEVTGDLAGAAVSGSDDVNGDGKADVWIGAPDVGSGLGPAGAAYLVTTTGKVDLSASVRAKVRGAAAGDLAGAAVLALQANGDAQPDVVIGAPGYDRSVLATDAGAVYLLHGPVAGTVNLSGTYAARFLGPTGSGFGATLAAGDFGIAAGAPSEGKAYVLAATATTGDATAKAKATVAGGADALAVGDLDGDGSDDLVVGASAGAGAARVFLAPLSGSLAAGDADHTAAGGGTDACGAAVAVGDHDGDGTDDLGVGCPREGAGTAGSAAVLLNLAKASLVVKADAALRVYGEQSNARLGAALASDDLDADGLWDWAVGAPLHDRSGADVGMMGVALGGAAGVVPASKLGLHYGSGAGDAAGSALAPAGDVDGDGLPDLLVGAPSSGSGTAGAYLVTPF